MAGRPRLPIELAHASGAILKNPAHVAGQHPNESAPLGDPHNWMDLESRQAWAQFKSEVAWLKECHRALMEMMAPMRIMVKSGLAKSGDRTLYLSMLREIGATPGSEGKVPHGHKVDPFEDDEFDA